MRACPAATVLFAALLACAGPVLAQVGTPEAEPRTPAALGLKGQATLKAFGYAEETPNDHRLFHAEAILQLEWSRRWEWATAKIVGDFQKDTDGFVESAAFQVPERGERRSVASLREAAVAVRGEQLEVTLGKQVFAWGTADAHNPTDHVNPYDYLDVLDNEKLAVYAAAGRLSVGATTLTAVVVPVFTPSRVPLRESRWTPLPPEGFVAVVDERELPARSLRNAQYAARLRTTVRGWDVSASYYEGFEHTPVFRRSEAEDEAGRAVPRFTPLYTRVRAVGLDFSTSYRRLEVHGEGAVTLVERNGRDDRFQWITGINYTLDGPVPWVEDVAIILEYARQEVLRSRPESGIVPSGDSPEVGDLLANNAFRNALVGRIVVRFSEDTQLKLTGIADFTGPVSYYVQVKLAHRLSDAVQVEGGLDIIEGARDTFWGRWRDNDRLFVWLRYVF